MFYKVEISAEDRAQADNILNALLAKKLITGGQMIAAPARFLWKGSVADMEYWMITSYTSDRYKEAIITEVEKVSVEEIPMVTFTPIEVNPKLLQWIEATLG